MRQPLIILLCVVAGFSHISRPASAQTQRRFWSLPSDSNIIDRTVDSIRIPESERTEKLYDSIRAKTSRTMVADMLYHSLFRRPGKDTTQAVQVVDEYAIYRRFEGRTIGRIYMQRDNVYPEDSRGIPRYANNLHALTRERVIRRDLLIHPGDKVDAHHIVANKQLLLSRSYISEVDITLVPHQDDPSVVDVLVWTRDSWSIGFDGRWRGQGRTAVDIYDANFLGYGNRIVLKTNFDRRNWKHHGNMVEYDMSNMFGTFFRGNITVGRDFYDNLFRVGVQKDFIRVSDYQAGVAFNNDRMEYYAAWKNSEDSIHTRRFDTWLGRSHYLKTINSSVYYSGRFHAGKFSARPEVTPEINPAFHNYNEILLGAGLYREKFYSANMIYGYGYQEYLPLGYRAEITGGFNRGEFHDDYYVGASFHRGGFIPIGYVRAEVDAGSYIHSGGGWWRSTLDLHLRWFSNLYRLRLSNIRQFVSLNYTGERNDEVIMFTKLNGPKTFNETMTGRSRAVLNTETVIFTPYQPFGFRLAVFSFLDFGLLGDHANIFRNELFSTVGLGIRLKNERLVFNALQIRLGMAIGKTGLLHNEYVRLTSEQRVTDYRFIPTYPQTVYFK